MLEGVEVGCNVGDGGEVEEAEERGEGCFGGYNRESGVHDASEGSERHGENRVSRNFTHLQNPGVPSTAIKKRSFDTLQHRGASM